MSIQRENYRGFEIELVAGSLGYTATAAKPGCEPRFRLERRPRLTPDAALADMKRQIDEAIDGRGSET